MERGPAAPRPGGAGLGTRTSVLLGLWVGSGATGLEGTGPDCAWALLCPAPRLTLMGPRGLPAQKLTKVLDFHHQAGSTCLPGLGLGQGVPAGYPQTTNCLLSLSWRVFISGQWAWLGFLGWWKDRGEHSISPVGSQFSLGGSQASLSVDRACGALGEAF